MERAGQRVFEQIESTFPSLESLAASIFLGRGNNAGDGLVVARLLAEKGAKVILHYLHPPEEFSPDAAKNHARLAALRDEREDRRAFLYVSGWQELARKALEDSDLIVDALLGTGLNKAVGEEYAAVIDVMNESELPIVSIDIPSGVNADTGEIMGAAVVADATVTMGLPKIGCLFYPGKGCAGDLVVGDIGVPRRGDRRAGDHGARRSISSGRSRIFPCGSRRRTSSRAARSSSSRGAAATRERRCSPRSRRSGPDAESCTARALNRSVPSSRGPRPK